MTYTLYHISHTNTTVTFLRQRCPLSTAGGDSQQTLYRTAVCAPRLVTSPAPPTSGHVSTVATSPVSRPAGFHPLTHNRGSSLLVDIWVPAWGSLSPGDRVPGWPHFLGCLDPGCPRVCVPFRSLAATAEGTPRKARNSPTSLHGAPCACVPAGSGGAHVPVPSSVGGWHPICL